MQFRKVLTPVLLTLLLQAPSLADDFKLIGTSKGEYREGALAAGWIDGVPINVGTDGKYIKIEGGIEEVGDEVVSAVVEAKEVLPLVEEFQRWQKANAKVKRGQKPGAIDSDKLSVVKGGETKEGFAIAVADKSILKIYKYGKPYYFKINPLLVLTAIEKAYKSTVKP